jgi:hypothetical protein
MRVIDYIGKTGVIVSDGGYKNWRIKIQDDSLDTGGYLILIWSNTSDEGFDDWVKSEEDLQKYFEHSSWIVDWGI